MFISTVGSVCVGYSMWLRYLEAKRVEAAVCLAANRAVGLNLHGVQQVLLTEMGRPAHVKLGLLNAAGPKVMELETRRKVGNIVMSPVLLMGPQRPRQ